MATSLPLLPSGCYYDAWSQYRHPFGCLGGFVVAIVIFSAPQFSDSPGIRHLLSCRLAWGLGNQRFYSSGSPRHSRHLAGTAFPVLLLFPSSDKYTLPLIAGSSVFLFQNGSSVLYCIPSINFPAITFKIFSNVPSCSLCSFLMVRFFHYLIMYTFEKLQYMNVKAILPFFKGQVSCTYTGYWDMKIAIRRAAYIFYSVCVKNSYVCLCVHKLSH